MGDCDRGFCRSGFGVPHCLTPDVVALAVALVQTYPWFELGPIMADRLEEENCAAADLINALRRGDDTARHFAARELTRTLCLYGFLPRPAWL